MCLVEQHLNNFCGVFEKLRLSLLNHNAHSKLI